MRSHHDFRRFALLTLAAAFVGACADGPTSHGESPTEPSPGFEQVTGPSGVDLQAAVRIHSRHTPDLMDIPGVVGTGLGVEDDGARIRVYTLHGNVNGIPEHVDRIPVERVVTGLILAGDLNDPATRQRPAPNGFSLGHPDITAGTLGALVRDPSDDVCYALSNNHVLANSNEASIGDNALQPGPFDGGSDPADAIGTLADFQPFDFSGDNVIDAAVAELFDAASVTGSTPSYAYGAPSSSPRSASLDMLVQKFGRTTGHTHGIVEEINVTVDVCYETRGPFRCVLSARFVDQISITDASFSAGGDSGSLIVTDDGSADPVGLLFAGSDTRTLANPIDPVLDRFGVVIETDPASCSNGSGSPDNQPPTADFSWTADGLTVQFTDGSSDTDGSIATRSWDFGDGSTSTATNPSHTYPADGDYTVQLTVTDDDGASDLTEQTVSVSDGSTGGGIELGATGTKVRGIHVIELAWTGAASTNVDVYRDGGLVATTANDGAYTDDTGNRGGATYTHQVCEAGTSTCSNEDTTVF